MKIISTFFVAFLAATSFAYAQQDKAATAANEASSNNTFVETTAQFPGGEQACFKFLSENIVYPPECQEKGIQGRVIVSFDVCKDGTLDAIKALRSPDPALAKEAERVVAMMPKWQPAMQGNKPVRSKMRLPIMFRLSTPPAAQTPALAADSISAQTVDGNTSDDDNVYDIVETAAQFPGGMDACMKWLNEHVKYPVACMEAGIQGRVIISFVVNKDGSIVDLKEVRSPHPALTKEMFRLVRSMPKWTPASQGSETVRSRFMLPMMFKLR